MSLPLFSESFDAFARTAAPVAVAGLWQGLAVFAGLALCLKFAPRITAAQRFLLWATAFVTLATLPVAGLALNSFGKATPASDFSATTAHSWLQLDARWTFVLAGLWLAASLIRATDLAIGSLRLRRLWRTATPIDFPASSHTARAFEVCSTQFLDRPSVIGFFAPRILIPDWLLPRLTPGELNQIVLHEATHLNRRDDWTNLFQKLCLVLFPLNPALWCIERLLAKEREMACDEAVVRITQAPRAYAACLANLAERGLEHRTEALSLGAWQHRSELVHRVQSILHRNRLMHPIAARALLGALACGLLIVTGELARCPQLVAFVPAAQPTSTIAQSDQLGDVAYPVNARPAKLPAGFRAVQARAEMPSTPVANNGGNRARTNLKTAAVGELRASSEPAISHSHRPAQPLEQLAVSQPVLAAKSANGKQSTEQQWVVFTAWEQVETTAASTETPAAKATFADKTGTTADYDTGDSPETHTNNPNATTTSRMRVTQLVFKVLPTNSKSSHTTAIPFGDGWLVIQL